MRDGKRWEDGERKREEEDERGEAEAEVVFGRGLTQRGNHRGPVSVVWRSIFITISLRDALLGHYGDSGYWVDHGTGRSIHLPSSYTESSRALQLRLPPEANCSKLCLVR